MTKRIFISILLIVSGFGAFAQDTIPDLNKQILTYVNTVIGKKVDRGECWDLANRALVLTNAIWDYQFKYGKLLNPKKDSIFPGDIIQFKNVLVQYKSADGLETTTETMGQHTAIVYKVLEKGVFLIAHQNNSFSGRKVGVSKLSLSAIKRGKIFIYRPQK